MKKLLLLLLIFSAAKKMSGQSTYVPLGFNEYWMMDRLEILNGKFLNGIHTSHKPYLRENLFDSIPRPLNNVRDICNQEYIENDNSEFVFNGGFSKKNTLKYFYQTKADLYNTQTHDFMLKINPVVYFGFGKEQGDGENLFINTRGAEFRGWIAQKVGFYITMTDNQERLLKYVQKESKKLQALPGEGYYKSFHTTGYDFFNTRGYITFKAAKFINFQFGEDKNFIGNGYRSLFLSDNSDDYLFLKLNTQIWKLSYENIFTQLIGNYFRKGDKLLPKKYAAFHHLSLNATKFLNVGLFESVVFHRDNGYELSYLNPIIFYRAIEQGLGSPDNAFMGVDFKLNAFHHFSFYGQFMLDDLNFFQFKNNKGYWGSKFGGQLGVKYINAFTIPHLDLQAEFNAVRPYVYTHSDTIADYSNYNQPLAHPLGANFKEVIGILRYQPLKNLFVTAMIFMDVKGEDTLDAKTGRYLDDSNWGGNIFHTANEKNVASIYGNSIGQGIYTKTMTASLTISYMVRHNLFLDLDLLYRKSDSAMDIYDLNTMSAMFSLRLNIAQRRNDF